MRRVEGEIVLAADTTVALGRRIFGKPADRTEAEDFLKRLQGRRHKVITAVVLVSDAGLRERCVESIVKFKRLSDDELSGYLDSRDWQGKAGAYAMQGAGAVQAIEPIAPLGHYRATFLIRRGRSGRTGVPG